MYKLQKYNSSGFTLIELLVVIAIIGILSSVVLSSLNTARTKGQIAAIKSNLKNMIPQAELSYDVSGNYSTVCSDIKIVSMITAITNAGGNASCYSFDNTRWGVSAYLSSDPIQNFAVDSSGVVIFDKADLPIGAKNWADANTACSAAGGHLPSAEELKALWKAHGSIAIPSNTGFNANWYWSGTADPSNINNAYIVVLNASGSFYSQTKNDTNLVHCVR